MQNEKKYYPEKVSDTKSYVWHLEDERQTLIGITGDLEKAHFLATAANQFSLDRYEEQEMSKAKGPAPGWEYEISRLNTIIQKLNMENVSLKQEVFSLKEENGRVKEFRDFDVNDAMKIVRKELQTDRGYYDHWKKNIINAVQEELFQRPFDHDGGASVADNFLKKLIGDPGTTINTDCGKIPGGNLKEAIRLIREALDQDKGYFDTWKANIAVSFTDHYFAKGNFTLSTEAQRDVVHKIANEAAEDFLNRFITLK